MNISHTRTLILAAICLAFVPDVNAQFSLTGQLRTRTEYRNGVGTPRPLTNMPAFFTSQRTRVSFGYKNNRINFFTSIQDVRVWGQDASSISNADGSKLGIHEAWAELTLANKKDTSFKKSKIDYFGIKIGRQEIMYDDSRLLGNLDWLQQGRRHDAVICKVLNTGWQLDIGAAFNQNTDAFNYNGTYYTPANVTPYIKDSKGNLVPTPVGLIPIVSSSGVSVKSGSLALANAPGTNAIGQYYKALQFLYASKMVSKTKVSALILSDQFSRYRLDSVKTVTRADTGYIYGRRYDKAGVNARYTAGLLLTSILDKKKLFTLTIGANYQAGKDKDGLKLSAYTTTASLTYSQKAVTYTIGWDYLSGNDAFSTSTVNHRFDPLYGTPHKFWGLMDYFYVGTGSPTGGLSNPFAKIKYTSKTKRFNTGLDYHFFSLAKNQNNGLGVPVNKYLGSEFDWVSIYQLNKFSSLEVGLCYVHAGKSMEYAKAVAINTTKADNTWAYLQINIKPDFLSK